MHRTECILRHSLLNRALSRWRHPKLRTACMAFPITTTLNSAARPHAHPLSVWPPMQQLFMIDRAVASTSGNALRHSGPSAILGMLAPSPSPQGYQGYQSQCMAKHSFRLKWGFGAGGASLPSPGFEPPPPPPQDSSATHDRCLDKALQPCNTRYQKKACPKNLPMAVGFGMGLGFLFLGKIVIHDIFGEAKLALKDMAKAPNFAARFGPHNLHFIILPRICM